LHLCVGQLILSLTAMEFFFKPISFRFST